MPLLKSQKNVLFDKIVSKGLSPLQFDIKEEKKFTIISYKNSNHYFKINSYESIHYSPGYKTFSNNVDLSIHPDAWNSICAFFSAWLRDLLREIEQPDKWNDLLESSKQISWHIELEPNSRFTYSEVLEIENSIKQIKSDIKSLNLLPEQLQLIDAKLDYLCDKAKTLGSIDWKNILMGTLISLVVELALPSDTAKTLWHIFEKAFKKVIAIALN